MPGAVFTIDELDVTTGVVTELTSVERLFPEDIKKRVLELMPTHPAMPAYKAGARGAIRVTACITQRQFRETPHYRETLLPVGLRYQTVVTLDIPGKIAGMTVIRDKDFTDREVSISPVDSPQIALAHRNAQTFTALKRSAARTIPAPDDLQRVGLTAREGEVLHWVIQGKRDGEVAGILSTSPRTIHNHLRNILRKRLIDAMPVLKVNSRMDEILKARPARRDTL